MLKDLELDCILIKTKFLKEEEYNYFNILFILNFYNIAIYNLIK